MIALFGVELLLTVVLPCFSFGSGDASFLPNVPLTSRNLFLNVEQDQDIPPKLNDGKHTLSDWPFTAALRSHDLN